MKSTFSKVVSYAEAYLETSLAIVMGRFLPKKVNGF